jgi:hypothetical protein
MSDQVNTSSGGAGVDASGMPQTASAQEAHLLSLKVMRLSKPTLQLPTPSLTIEAGEVRGNQKKEIYLFFFYFFSSRFLMKYLVSTTMSPPQPAYRPAYWRCRRRLAKSIWAKRSRRTCRCQTERRTK